MGFGQRRRRPFPLCRCGYTGIDYVLGWWPRAVDVNARPTMFLIGIPREIKGVDRGACHGTRFGGMPAKAHMEGGA